VAKVVPQYLLFHLLFLVAQVAKEFPGMVRVQLALLALQVEQQP
jgi:hypothetical protein